MEDSTCQIILFGAWFRQVTLAIANLTATGFENRAGVTTSRVFWLEAVV